jgi:hypothetical protein
VWLSFPWSIAPSVFLTIAPQAMPAQILFTEAARRFGPPQRFSVSNLAKLGFLLLASYLTYESFYFVFILVAFFSLLFHRNKLETRRQTFTFLGVVFGSQLAAIVINRWLAHLNPAGSKSFAANWRGLFVGSLKTLPTQLNSTIVEADIWWIYALCVVAAASLLLLGIAFFKPPERRSASGAVSIFLMGASALVGMTLIYSLAGYFYSVRGVESRTLFGASWAITVMFFALVSTVLLANNPAHTAIRAAPFFLLKFSLIAAAFALIALNGVSQRAALADWAYVWEHEQAILKQVPVEKIKALPPDSRILYIGPSYYNSLVIFGAYWDLTAAAFSLPELSRGRTAFQGLTTIHAATTLYHWRWDGQELFQELPPYWTMTFPASHLFIWDYDQRSMSEAAPGYEYPTK